MTNIHRYSFSANKTLANSSWTELSTIKSNMSYLLILHSERALPFRRSFKMHWIVLIQAPSPQGSFQRAFLLRNAAHRWKFLRDQASIRSQTYWSQNTLRFSAKVRKLASRLWAGSDRSYRILPMEAHLVCWVHRHFHRESVRAASFGCYL